MSGQQGRQYEGFTYPGGADGAGPSGMYPYNNTATSATPLGGGFGGTTGLVRRSTSTTATAAPMAGGGYNYFHQHTNSTGGHSAFGSESGSVTSSRVAAANQVPTSAGAALVSVSIPAGGGGVMDAMNRSSGGGSQGSHRVPFVQASPNTTAMQFVDFNASAPPASVGSDPRSPGPFYPSSASPGPAGGGDALYANTDGFGGAGPSNFSGSPSSPSGRARQPFAQPPLASGHGGAASPSSQAGLRSDGQGGGRSAGGGGGGMFGRLFGAMLKDMDDTDDSVPRAGDAPRPLYQTRFGFPDDDLPLLDELGINPKSILKEARVVLNPLGSAKVDPKDVTDLAGPLVFVVSLAFLLSLQKKEMQFSAIYGLSVVGLVFFKVLLSLMSTSGVSIIFVMSALGYSLLPSLLLALLRTVVREPSIVLPCAVVVVLWSSWCATALLVKGLEMDKQRFLILYPVFLFYSVFATLTIF